MTLKVYANEHPRNKKKKDNNLKVASASQIKKNEKISNKILKILEASEAIKATGKKLIKKKR